MKKNKIALIGAGNWGKNYLRVLEKLGVLAALAEKEASVREKYASLYPQLYITDDYKKLLTNPAIDAFVVATPAHTHYQIAQEILLANKDVLLEKPMTLSVSEAKTLHKIAEKNRGVLLVGHLLLYKPAIQKIKELIENKILGDLLCIDMKRAKLGTIRNYENVLWSFAPHDLAVLLSLVKAKVTEINAVGQKLLQAQREDNIHLYLHFAN
ncbi:MAG: Gfo/Idh/MocA family oxidoreductase, partial [Firmicutes bacterium]|nr:Gfo/Idh/MocA family oxidoreductase [Bacillota bacterium]